MTNLALASCQLLQDDVPVLEGTEKRLHRHTLIQTVCELVFLDEREWVTLPVFRLRFDNVQMGQQQNRFLAGGAIAAVDHDQGRDIFALSGYADRRT